MRFIIKCTFFCLLLYYAGFFGVKLVSAQEQKIFPYEQCFTVTGYYSPLPDQEKYATGSYQSEIRLEGRGTNGADGTQVYVGMLAAPPEIPFDTKITVPGVGTGAVHDRGGGIKIRPGECGSSLDVWMGYGDKGRERSINWGVRRVLATVYGIDDAVEENIILEGYSEAESLLREKIIFFKPKYFTKDLGPGDQNNDVERLQRKLAEWGYYSVPVTGFYGPETQEAVFRFQTEFDVLSDSETIGAGYFGINTRTAYDRAVLILDKDDRDIFPLNLGHFATGPNVRFLKQKLTDLGYLSAEMVTDIYDDQTVDAVLTFQLDFKVIQDSFDTGAGYFGPATRTTMARILSKKDFDTENGNAKAEFPLEIVNQDGQLDEDLNTIPATLSLGDKGEQVKHLQQELARLGYFRHEITGYYGQVTAHAVFKLQQAWSMVSSKEDSSAGRVDSMMASRLNLLSQDRFKIKTLIAANKMQPMETTVAFSNETSGSNPAGRQLDLGDRGEDVKNLQQRLKSLGYFRGTFITDYYGEFTQQAVLAFQLDKGIIKSSDELGAGRVGDKTLEVLMQS